MTEENGSGNWLKKKGFLGLWCNRFCELIGTQLIVSKDEEKKCVEEMLDIMPTTRIEIISDDKDKPRFVIQPPNKETETVFEATSFNEMMRWVLTLRGVTFTNPDLNMDCFEILSIIGRGYYGKVRLVKSKETGDIFAIKSIKKMTLLTQNKFNSALFEKNILAKASHPFIVSLKFAFQSTSKFYLGLEYVPGGELFNRIHKHGYLSKAEYKLVLAQVAIALDYLHSIGVIYRDVKPENILIGNDGYIKLTDFGLAKDLTIDTSTSTFCGTPEYMAPEIVKRQEYDEMVDWWGLGILMYDLIYHKTPFWFSSCGDDTSSIYKRIVQNEPKFPKDADPNEMSLIMGLLNKDPTKRFNYSDVKNHPFFADLNFEDVLSKKIKPEYVPEIDSKATTENFDVQFTSECKDESYGVPMVGDLAAVPGFSYTEQNFANDIHKAINLEDPIFI